MGHGKYNSHPGMYHPKGAQYGYHHMSNSYAFPRKGKAVTSGQPYGDATSSDQAAANRAVEEAPEAAGKQDIVSIAAGSADFETLVTAVKAAGLADTLSTKGPFTLFAPTDAAFAKLPVEKLAALLADKEALTRVLTYHVVPGTVSADAVTKLSSAKTVEGGSLTIDATDGVKINDANVVKADIQASNGIIHVIDSVILPN